MAKRFSKKAFIGAIVVTTTVLGGSAFALLCTERVPAGYVAGQYSMNGGVKQEVLPPGWHLVSPAIKTSLYSTATEQLIWSADKEEGSKDDESFDVTCRDGKLKAEFEMSYSFDADVIPMIMEKYRGISGEDIVNTKLSAKIRSYITEETSKFTIMDAYLEKKSELNKSIFDRLKKELKTYGITVESANLITTPDDKLAKTIAERAESNEKLEKIKLDKQIAQEEAEKKKIEAQGKAEAAIIEAEGKAEANKVLQQSLTSELLKQQAIEAWKAGGSQVPQVVGSDTITNLK